MMVERSIDIDADYPYDPEESFQVMVKPVWDLNRQLD